MECLHAFRSNAITIVSDTDSSLLSVCSVLWRNHQLLHPRAHVWLLWPGSLGTSGAEVPLVEEIPHHYSDGGYYLRVNFCVFSVGVADMYWQSCSSPKHVTYNIFVQMLKYLVKDPSYDTNLLALIKLL